MKISSILRSFIAAPAGNAGFPDESWVDDPYAHPDIDAMNERERADLPPVHAALGRRGAPGGSPFRIACT